MTKIEYALRQAKPSEGGIELDTWANVVDELRKIGAISGTVALKLLMPESESSVDKH